jgi:hypothetical protein
VGKRLLQKFENQSDKEKRVGGGEENERMNERSSFKNSLSTYEFPVHGSG